MGDGTIDIHRLMVAPRAFRRGVASALLEALEEAFPDRRMVVSTGSANGPALALYQGRGFTATGEREVVPGLFVTGLERPPRIRPVG
jgi:ribosomal protein S18 acetylase RimI-like enzyme